MEHGKGRYLFVGACVRLGIPARAVAVGRESAVCVVLIVFFFSSRRRHTRSLCDWSSDVCSSDLEFASKMRKQHGFEMAEFSPGGGFAVAYTPEQSAPEPAVYAETITSTLRGSLWRYELAAPQLIREPGRARVGRAAVGRQTVGCSKEVPGGERLFAVGG